MPALAPLALGMTSAAVLRSVGDARRAMLVTLVGAIVNTALDPIFIFVLGLGIHGAAIASALSRLAVLGIGLYGVIRVHGLMGRPKLRPFLSDVPAVLAVAMPAVLTNIATPVSNAYITAAIAPFGDSAVAGWAILGRIMPVAFGAIFALSGTVGPILGQNYGARAPDRVRETYTQALKVTLAFTAAAWLLLAVFAEPLARAFQATAEAAALIVLFCRWLAPLFVFLGALFVSNAAFNTLGRPHVSTALNWGRATLGTFPSCTPAPSWRALPACSSATWLATSFSASPRCGCATACWTGSAPAQARSPEQRPVSCLIEAAHGLAVAHPGAHVRLDVGDDRLGNGHPGQALELAQCRHGADPHHPPAGTRRRVDVDRRQSETQGAGGARGGALERFRAAAGHRPRAAAADLERSHDGVADDEEPQPVRHAAG